MDRTCASDTVGSGSIPKSDQAGNFRKLAFTGSQLICLAVSIKRNSVEKKPAKSLVVLSYF